MTAIETRDRARGAGRARSGALQEREQEPLRPRERAQKLFERVGKTLPSNSPEALLTDPDGEWHTDLHYDQHLGALDMVGLRRFGIDGQVAETHIVDALGGALYVNIPLGIRERGEEALSKAEARWNSLLRPAEQRFNPRILPTPLAEELLSRRELEVLDHVGRGQANKVIANELQTAEQTVKNHMSAILKKLEANDRTEALVKAIRRGLISIEK